MRTLILPRALHDGQSEALAGLDELGIETLMVDGLESALADGTNAETDVNAFAERLSQRLVKAGAAPNESFLVCHALEAAFIGHELGCRPVLVLGERSLDEALGPGEPANKAIAIAPTIEQALHFIADEARASVELGAFPYGSASSAAPASPLMPTARDLAKLFGLTAASGVAVALGAAYLLQELYQNLEFPPIFYYLTLQFIPQTLRGLIFLLLGATIGLLAPRLERRIREGRAG